MNTSQDNPLVEGLGGEPLPQACTLVIFGGAGDLSRRKLLPALYNLGLDGLLPAQFAVVAFSRDDMADESFKDVTRKGIEKYSRRAIDEEDWQEFSQYLHYQQGSFDNSDSYEDLKKTSGSFRKAIWYSR